VSAGILRRCRSDDDLALVIAHELAHNLLRHGRRSYSPVNRQGRLSLPADAAPRGAQESEEEADRLAVRLARAAGYDLSGAESFLTGLAGASAPVLQAGTHPPLERRLALLRAEIAADKH
jgi:predicted Zn-dependent protease